MAARNMQRIEINIYEKEFCVRLVIYKYYTEMHRSKEHKKQRAEFANTKWPDTTEYKQQAIAVSIPFMHTQQHDKYANTVQIPAKSYVADLYSLMIWLHKFIPSVQNRSGHCKMHTRPINRKPKPWRTGSASQMPHFDKFSADNTAYL